MHALHNGVQATVQNISIVNNMHITSSRQGIYTVPLTQKIIKQNSISNTIVFNLCTAAMPSYILL